MAFAYFMSYLVPLLVVAGIHYGGAAYLLCPAYVFLVHPLMDLAVGRDTPENSKLDVAPWLARILREMPAGYVLIQMSILCMALVKCNDPSLGPWKMVGLIASVGALTGALGITAAHELVHRKARWERGLGVGLLSMVNYNHFRIEHVFGHHKYIATPNDPATSRLGEALPAFWARSIIGCLRSAWRIESKRLQRQPLARRLSKNRMIHYALFQAGVFAAVFALFGVKGAVFFAAQSAVAIGLLETTNYIEHYGIVRHKDANGHYEPVQEWHSWDSHFRMTNWNLFNLERHSHHHAVAHLEYNKLLCSDKARSLPYGYSVMVLIALVPPLWRAVMDPRLKEIAPHEEFNKAA